MSTNSSSRDSTLVGRLCSVWSLYVEAWDGELVWTTAFRILFLVGTNEQRKMIEVLCRSHETEQQEGMLASHRRKESSSPSVSVFSRERVWTTEPAISSFSVLESAHCRICQLH